MARVVLGVVLVLIAILLGPCIPQQIDLTALDQEKPVIHASLVFRHGDRTPARETYPNDPIFDKMSHIWPEGPYQLTNKGKMEAYKMGEWLRRRYDRLLGDIYSHSKLRMVSSSTDRTIMTAMCVLAGLFPPKGYQVWNPDILWQPIPVHAYDEAANIINRGDRVDCPRFWKQLDLVLESPQYLALLRKYNNLRDYLRENMGKEPDFLLNGDVLYYFQSQISRNITIPKWADKVFPEPWQSATGELLTLYTYNDVLKRLFIGVMLREMRREMSEVKLGTSRRKLNLYSGHELNVAGLLNTLGLYNNMVPSHTSVVLLELRKDSHNNHFVTVFYKNSTKEDAHILEMPGCEHVCPLARFQQLVSPYELKNMLECREDYVTSASHMIQGRAILVLMLVATMKACKPLLQFI